MIEFSEITEDDVEQISIIESETFSMPWKAEDFLEMISLDYAYYIAARENGVPIGCCGIRNMCGDGEITNVVIRKDKRGFGIGEEMLRFLMEKSREIGVRNYTLEVRASNQPAIKLYEKLGFKTEGIRKGFYDLPKEDALIMWMRPKDTE